MTDITAVDMFGSPPRHARYPERDKTDHQFDFTRTDLSLALAGGDLRSLLKDTTPRYLLRHRGTSYGERVAYRIPIRLGKVRKDHWLDPQQVILTT